MRYILVLFLAFQTYFVNAQWTTGNPWTGIDPEIKSINPDIILNNDGVLSNCGIIFKNNNVIEGFLFYNKFENILSFAKNGNVLTGPIAIDLDDNSNSYSTNGFFTVGPRNDIHLSMDGEMIQARDGSTLPSDLRVNTYGGNVDISNSLLYINDSSEKIGIKKTNPHSELDIYGDLTLSDASGSIDFRGSASQIVGRLRLAGLDMLLENFGGTTSRIVFSTGKAIQFATGNYTRMIVNSQGFVGIKNTNPEFELDVYGDIIFSGNQYIYKSGHQNPDKNLFVHSPSQSDYRLYYNDLEDQFRFQLYTSDALTIGEHGIGIFSTSEAFELQVDGDVDITGELTAVSDMRLKKEIEPIHNAVETILDLNPVSYEFRIDEYPDLNLVEDLQYGLLAQDVEGVLPTLISQGGEVTHIDGESFDVKSVNYIELIPILIKATQELAEENRILRERVNSLEVNARED